MNSRNPSHFLTIALLVALGCRDLELVDTAAEVSASVNADRAVQLALTSGTFAGGGGLRLNFYDGGNAGGPAIVFIHGFTGNYLSWEPQLSGPLTKDYRLVAYDLRGHGASEKPLDATKYTDGTLWADDLDALIRERHLDRPVLVGWSYGGIVISDYVRRYGDGAIGGLVFLGAITKNGTPEAAGYLTDEARAVFPDVFSADVQKSIDGTRTLTRMFANPLHGAQWEVAYGSAMMVPPAVRGAMFARLLDNDDVLATVHVPTLVIHGAADRIVKVSAARHIAATIPGARLLVYDGVGHAVQLDAPQRLDRDLSDFVRAAQLNRP